MNATRFALRRLWRFKGSSLTSIALLALGIGASTAIFSVANTYVFTPTFPGEERLFAFWPELPSGNRVEISYPEFFDWQAELDSFSDLAVMWSSSSKRVFRNDGELGVVPFRWVSASFFETLGVAPQLGRAFVDEDTESGADCVTVTSYGFWRSHLGGNPGALGEVLDGEAPCTVVGVMPRGFAFPRDVDLWLPLRREASVMKRGRGILWGVGRIARGVNPEAARTELDELNRRIDDEHFGATMPVTMTMRPIR